VDLGDEEWQLMVPAEGRSVGALVHHVAGAYKGEVDVALSIASGKPMVGLTWGVIDGMNAKHAAANARVDKDATLEMLRQNSAQAAERVRQFSDEQLDTAAPLSLYSDALLTAQFFIEDHALRHSFHHTANIKAALSS